MNEDQSNIEAAKNLARIYFPEELMDRAILDIVEEPKTGAWLLLLLNDEDSGKVIVASFNGKMVLSHEVHADAVTMEVLIETPLTWERFSDALHTMEARHQISGEIQIAEEKRINDERINNDSK